MVERRPLIDGLASTPAIDPQREKEFVYGTKPAEPPPVCIEPMAVPIPDRMPISTRIRGDFAAALKRASLERELNGVKPFAVQDILEQALEPWLKTNGYIA